MMRIVFMGTPDFSLNTLEALCKHPSYEVVCVYTQSPKPRGRGQEILESPIHHYANRKGLMVRHPKTLRSEEEQAFFKSLRADFAVVVAYGLLLPKAILSGTKSGCINVHASLLPHLRGAAPLQYALLNGDAETGITTMFMDEGLDTGDMLLKEKVPIHDSMTLTELHDTMKHVGAHLLMQTLEAFCEGTLIATKQPKEGTLAPKIKKEEGIVSFQQCCVLDIDRKVRALNPWPGTFFMHKGEVIRVLKARPYEVKEGAIPYEPGTFLLIQKRLFVVCLKGVLELEILQRSHKRPVPGFDFINGFGLPFVRVDSSIFSNC